MSGRSGWGGWPPQPIPGTAQPAATPTKDDDDAARDTVDTARKGAGDTTWHPPTPPAAPAPDAGHSAS